MHAGRSNFLHKVALHAAVRTIDFRALLCTSFRAGSATHSSLRKRSSRSRVLANSRAVGRRGSTTRPRSPTTGSRTEQLLLGCLEPGLGQRAAVRAAPRPRQAPRQAARGEAERCAHALNNKLHADEPHDGHGVLHAGAGQRNQPLHARFGPRRTRASLPTMHGRGRDAEPLRNQVSSILTSFLISSATDVLVAAGAGAFANPQDHVITVHGFADDGASCREIADALNTNACKETGGEQCLNPCSCDALN